MRHSINESNDLLTRLIGLTIEDAEKICTEYGYCCRLMREDTNRYMGTCDIRTDRFNLEVDNGVITGVGVG